MTCLILLSRCSGQCTQRLGKRTPALTRYFPMATIQASKGGRPYGGGQPLNWRRITQRAANEHWRTAQGPPRGRLRSKLGLRTYFGGIFWPQVSDKKSIAVPFRLMHPIRPRGRSSAESGEAGIDIAGADGGHGGKIHAAGSGANGLPPGKFGRYILGMAGSGHTINRLHDCPTCKATGRVESRLPFRQKVCPQCGGTGHVSLMRREQLLKRVKERA